MKQIRIEQWPHLLATRGETILDAALKAGVPYPHNCRSGECGECKTKLVSGEVQQDPCCAEALSQTERADGLVLACRCRPKTDIVVRWSDAHSAGPAFPLRQITGRVQSIEKVSRSVSKLRIEPQGPMMAFAAGQYCRLNIADLPARSYSMANVPGVSTLEFHIAHVPDGLVSGHVHRELRAGDQVGLEGPFGSSFLRQDRHGPIIAIAGGTGLAPILSILHTALEINPERPAHVYFGVREEADIYAERILQRLAACHPNVSIDIVLSEGCAQSARRTGFVHKAFDEDFNLLPAACLYSAGPPPMVHAVKAVAAAKKIASQNVHADMFTAEPDFEKLPKRSFGQSLKRLFSAR